MVRFTIIHVGTLSMNRFWGEAERVRSPSATCTLLEAAGRRLLVDPSPGPQELAGLLFSRAGLRPEAIDAAFVTHFHGDHRMGIELFPGAAWLMAGPALAEWREGHPDEVPLSGRFVPVQGQLPDGVELLPTPGHTTGHHSLAADTRWGELVVAGDAVMTPEFFDAEEGFHNSSDPARAAETIREIKARARLVVPGHGNVVVNL